MKLFLVCLVVALVAVNADPIDISGNNIGDIVSVNVNLGADVTNNVESNLINLIMGFLNDQNLDLSNLDLSALTGDEPKAELAADSSSDAVVAKQFKLPANFKLPKDLSFLKGIKLE